MSRSIRTCARRSRGCRPRPWQAGAAAGEEDRGRLVRCRGARVGNGSRRPAAHPAQRNSGPPQGKRGPTDDADRRELPRPAAAGGAPAWALGMPMNASGSASARQVPRFASPIPGSIMTGTAPILNSAKVSAKNSVLGGTISTVRVPAVMPAPRSAHAALSHAASSSAPVIRVNPPRRRATATARASGCACAMRAGGAQRCSAGRRGRHRIR